MVLTRGFLFLPEGPTVDFDLAFHKAVENIWPNTTLNGCQFCLTQLWWIEMFIRFKCFLSSFYRDEISEIGK